MPRSSRTPSCPRTMRVAQVLALAGSICALLAGSRSLAADATWDLNAAGNWADDINWDTFLAPGINDGGTTINNMDTAVFGPVITAARTVTVDANRNIFGINFAGNSFAYSLSGGPLLLTNGGTIQTSGAGNNHADVVSAPLTIEGDGGGYTFSSDSTSVTGTARTLSITGSISGVSTGTNITTITLAGSNTGGTANGNVIGAGGISDGLGGGKLAIAKTGTGAWTLSGTNTYTGTVSVLSGTLNYTSLAALGAGTDAILLGDTSGSANVSLRNTNATADVNTTRKIIVQSGNTGTVTFGSNSGSTRNHTYSGTITLGSTDGDGHGITLTSGGGFGLMTFSGVISNPSGMTGAAGVVTISGGNNATLSLSGTNNFTGGVLLSSGKLSLNNPSALGTGTLTIDGGSFNQLVGSFTSNRNNAQIWNSNFSSSGNLTVDLGTGPVDLGATGTDATRIVTSSNTGNTGNTGLAIRGVISNGSNGTTVNLTKAGTGILTLGGASDYTGDTTITGGTLRLNGGNNRLPVTTNLTINGGETSGAKLDLNTRSQTVAGLSGGDGTVKGIVTNLATGTSIGTLTVTGTSTFDGIIQDGTTAKVALTKSVDGTLTLTGDNTYSGATTVSGGTLLLTGTIGGTTSVNIAGGTLEMLAAERINDGANLTLNGGTLKTDGFSDTVGTLTLSGPSTLDLGSGASVFTFGDSSARPWNGTLSILNWSGSVSGGGTDQLFFGTNEFGLFFDQVASITFVDPAGFSGTFAAQMLSTGELVAAIPEPSAAWSLLLGFTGLLGSYRSRRARKPSLR